MVDEAWLHPRVIVAHREDWTDRKRRWQPADGPWTTEPDEAWWWDPTTGLACHAVRGPVGAWCGYVGLPPEHPLFGIGYSEEHAALSPFVVASRLAGSDSELLRCSMDHVLDVHGGVTFTGHFERAPLPAPAVPPYEGHQEDVGKPIPSNNYWWVGFDCAHAGDLIPVLQEFAEAPTGLPALGATGGGDVYRTLDFVMAECARLAVQLESVAEEEAVATPAAPPDGDDELSAP